MNKIEELEKLISCLFQNYCGCCSSTAEANSDIADFKIKALQLIEEIKSELPNNLLIKFNGMPPHFIIEDTRQFEIEVNGIKYFQDSEVIISNGIGEIWFNLSRKEEIKSEMQLPSN